MTGLSASAQKVENALARLGMPGRVRELPNSTRSAAEAASAIGCDQAQIAKSLIFRGTASDVPVLAIVGGRNRADERRIAGLLGEPIERANAAFVREATGYAIGGVPPIAHARPLRTLIDRDLLSMAGLWAAAGTPLAVFHLTAQELIEITKGTVADIAAA